MLKPAGNSQRLLQLVAVGIGPPGGQLPADGDRFLGRGQRVLSPPQLREPELNKLFSEPARPGRNASGRATQRTSGWKSPVRYP